MQSASKNFRLHIAFFGRRNAGKSTIINTFTDQLISIVSSIPGTTTDPVEKPMELLPLGPVQLIDTAGLDDDGTIGEKRVQRTKDIFNKTELAVIVTHGNVWGNCEEEILTEIKTRKIPFFVVFNKTDLEAPSKDVITKLEKDKIKIVKISALQKNSIKPLRQAIFDLAPADYINRPSILADLVGDGESAVMVIPIDKEAPKGRIILPQVQAIRDLLDNNAISIVCKDSELDIVIKNQKKPPKLVVTDSQAFAEVGAITPDSIPLTSFSILFARFQGDLNAMVKGASAIGRLKPGDKILVAESCTHHPIEDDIGTQKIPKWLNKFVGGELVFEYTRGFDFPKDISKYKLVIHCGACVSNRRTILNRVLACEEQNVAITNYGLAIAYALGIFERALRPFPEALKIFKDSTK